MDLYAFYVSKNEAIKAYVSKHYGEVPRMRGVRLIKVEEPTNQSGYQMDMFNKYCGQDVIYIHTRCGGSNYKFCEADKWEESNKLFLEGVDDEFDCTYRDSYFKAIMNEEYEALKELFRNE